MPPQAPHAMGQGPRLTTPRPPGPDRPARGGVGYSDLADAGGGRQHLSERSVGICAGWRCRACGASIGLDRATGAVRLDTSWPETIRAMMR